MSAESRKYQHTTPVLIGGFDLSGATRALDRVSFAAKEHYDENWLQRLTYRFPQILPVREIEPAFGPLIPVCMELQTPAGEVDTFYVTPEGNLAIAECKLWRNPEARRRVLSQIIDYAHGIAKWTYTDLTNAIRRATSRTTGKMSGDDLFSLVSEETDIDEQRFSDAVTRNLRLGRMLLLLVGDGIREGVETLTEYLQVHAGFHFTLAIVEIAAFRLPPHGFLIHPRVLARTVNVERGIVRIIDERVTVDASSPIVPLQPSSISIDELLEQIAKASPQVPLALKHFQNEAEHLGVFLGATPKTLQIRWHGPDDADYTLAGITPDGQLRTMRVNANPDRIGRINLAHDYLQKIAALIGSNVRHTKDPKGWYVEGTRNRLPEAMELLSRPSQWLEIIRWYTGELSSAIEQETR